MGKMSIDKRDRLNTRIFIVMCVLVAAGWVYGFTWTGSEIKQQLSAAPLYMNILGVLWFLIFAFITYMYGTEKWTIKSIQYNSVPVIISIIFGLVGAIFIAANFWIGSY